MIFIYIPLLKHSLKILRSVIHHQCNSHDWYVLYKNISNLNKTKKCKWCIYTPSLLQFATITQPIAILICLICCDSKVIGCFCIKHCIKASIKTPQSDELSCCGISASDLTSIFQSSLEISSLFSWIAIHENQCIMFC